MEYFAYLAIQMGWFEVFLQLIMEQKLEDGLKRLSEIVKTLEQNESSLEDSLKLFEEGIKITRECHKKLTDAEKKIEILTRVSSEGIETKPLS